MSDSRHLRGPFRAQDSLLERGIWQAPWLGPNGELVLLAITAAHTLYGAPVIVPHSESRTEAVERLRIELDLYDPIADLRLVIG